MVEEQCYSSLFKRYTLVHGSILVTLFIFVLIDDRRVLNIVFSEVFFALSRSLARSYVETERICRLCMCLISIEISIESEVRIDDERYELVVMC